MKSYNRKPVISPRVELHTTIEIGWKHEVVEDEIIYELDDAGEAIPTSYTVPARLTPEKHLQAQKDMVSHVEDPTDLPVAEFCVHLVVEVLGEDVISQIKNDPTAEPEAFSELVLDLLELWGFEQLAFLARNPLLLSAQEI